jgi:hypothetical protein
MVNTKNVIREYEDFDEEENFLDIKTKNKEIRKIKKHVRKLNNKIIKKFNRSNYE